MAVTVRSLAELQKIIQGRLALALQMSQQQIYKVIQDHIRRYYEEPVFRGGSTIPSEYSRTYQFFNGLIKTGISVSGGVVSCEVKMDEGLSYIQPAETVLSMINSGLHADPSLNAGEYQTPRAIGAGSHFWDDAIEELGGKSGIYNIIVSNCRKVGLPIG